MFNSKKYILYLLIFFTLLTSLALFSLAKNTSAEALGTCIGVASSEYQGGTWNNVTEEWCDELRAMNPGANVSWTPNGYQLLQPLPCSKDDVGCENGQFTNFDPAGKTKLGEYLNLMITLFIGLCAVAAVIMIVIGGIEYATSDIISNKTAAKERIRSAILGLILALGSYTILFTINPDLLNLEPDVGDDVTLEVKLKEADIILVKEDGTLTSGTGGPINQASRGTTCDASILYNAAKASGIELSPSQQRTMLCIGGAESSGCKPIPANVPGVSGGGFGAWQVVISLHWDKFNNSPVCQQAAGTTSVSCRRGVPSRNQPASCIRAASSFACNASVAAAILRLQPNYFDWLQTQGPCANARCVRKHSPGTNLNIRLGPIPGRGAISNLAQYCNIR